MGDLPVGHPARPRVRTAFVAVLLAAGLFECFALITTQVKPLRAHSPWQNDPYDAVVSFTLFLVPLLCALCLVRVQLFRRLLPLAVQRVRDLLRASWVVLGLIGTTLAVDWISVILRADQATWTSVTLALTGMLLTASAAAIASGAAMYRASRQEGLGGPDLPGPAVDWAGDVAAVADLWSLRLGPLTRLAAPVSRWLRTVLLDGSWGVRRHPVLWAGGGALAFGTLLALAAAREEGVTPLLLLIVGVGASGMFAFLVIAGAFLGVVRGTAPASGARRRAIDAVTVTCATVPVTLALRDSLWWLIGTTGSGAGLGQLATLLAAVGGAAFLAVLAVETGLGIHRPAAG